uniref:Uncharacterized protein n=1 Tax=Cacopsylla melanoneura TaxID=428564 RepID=A0A8D8TFI6_9HEMI
MGIISTVYYYPQFSVLYLLQYFSRHLVPTCLHAFVFGKDLLNFESVRDSEILKESLTLFFYLLQCSFNTVSCSSFFWHCLLCKQTINCFQIRHKHTCTHFQQ